MALDKVSGPWPSRKVEKFAGNVQTAVNVLNPAAVRLETGASVPAFSGEHVDGWQQQSTKELMLRWNNGGSDPTKMAAMFMLPEDLDSAEDLTVHFLGTPTGANDSPTITVEAYLSGIGAAPAADSNCGGTSDEFTADTLFEKQTLTIDADDVISGEAALTLIFNPTSGELVTDDFVCASPWITFSRG